MVDSMPHTTDWNQENRCYKNQPRQFFQQYIRAHKQNLKSGILVREGFRAAWGRITAIHVGEPEECRRSLALYTETAEAPNAIQHVFITRRDNKQGDRNQIVQSADEAIGAAFGDILLTITAKDAKMPRLRWDSDLIENGVVPLRAERLLAPIGHISRVIVGLTTTPKRIDLILPTIKSLLTQTRPADQIILSVPERLARTGERFGDIPKELQELAGSGKLQIHRTKDYGPATKFIGPLEVGGNPDDMICWLDDDILYSPRLFQTLAEELRNRPKTALGVCGFFITGDKGYVLALDHGRHAEILEGFGGVICWRSDMPRAELWPAVSSNDFAGLTAMDRARFLADDYMISTQLQKAGTATLVCNTTDLNRMNAFKIRQEGLRPDALQNNKDTGGNHAAYALLKNG